MPIRKSIEGVGIEPESEEGYRIRQRVRISSAELDKDVWQNAYTASIHNNRKNKGVSEKTHKNYADKVLAKHKNKQ